MVNETSIVVRYKYTDIRGSTRKVYEDLDFFSFGIYTKRDFLAFRIIYAYIATQYTNVMIATYIAFDISICLFIIDFFIWGYILNYRMIATTLMLFWYYVYINYIFVYTIDGERSYKIWECGQVAYTARRVVDGTPSGRVHYSHDRLRLIKGFLRTLLTTN